MGQQSTVPDVDDDFPRSDLISVLPGEVIASITHFFSSYHDALSFLSICRSTRSLAYNSPESVFPNVQFCVFQKPSIRLPYVHKIRLCPRVVAKRDWKKHLQRQSPPRDLVCWKPFRGVLDSKEDKVRICTEIFSLFPSLSSVEILEWRVVGPDDGGGPGLMRRYASFFGCSNRSLCRKKIERPTDRPFEYLADPECACWGIDGWVRVLKDSGCVNLKEIVFEAVVVENMIRLEKHVEECLRELPGLCSLGIRSLCFRNDMDAYDETSLSQDGGGEGVFPCWNQLKRFSFAPDRIGGPGVFNSILQKAVNLEEIKVDEFRWVGEEQIIPIDARGGPAPLHPREPFSFPERMLAVRRMDFSNFYLSLPEVELLLRSASRVEDLTLRLGLVEQGGLSLASFCEEQLEGFSIRKLALFDCFPDLRYVQKLIAACPRVDKLTVFARSCDMGSLEWHDEPIRCIFPLASVSNLSLGRLRLPSDLSSAVGFVGALLEGAPGLKSLSLEGLLLGGVNDESSDEVTSEQSNFSRLSSFTISRTPLKSHLLSWLVLRCPNLHSVEFSQSDLSGEGLVEVDLSRLWHLSVAGHRMGEAGVAHILRTATSLRSLNLSCCGFDLLSLLRLLKSEQTTSSLHSLRSLTILRPLSHYLPYLPLELYKTDDVSSYARIRPIKPRVLFDLVRWIGPSLRTIEISHRLSPRNQRKLWKEMKVVQVLPEFWRN